MGREFLPEQNHTANPNCMLISLILDDNGPDRNMFIFLSIGYGRNDSALNDTWQIQS